MRPLHARPRMILLAGSLSLLAVTSGCVTPRPPQPLPEVDPHGSIERLLADAGLQAGRGDHETARRDYSEAFRQTRSITAPHDRRRLLSRCYLARGDWYVGREFLESARLDYERAMPGAGEGTRRDTLARLVLVAELTRHAADAERLRALLGPSGEGLVETLRATLFEPAVAAGTPPSAEVVEVDQVHARSEWHAAPLRPRQADAMTPIYRLTVHHTASPTKGPLTEDQAAAIIRSIQTAHFEKGWADIGYHFLIDSSGRVWQGRPLEWQGAHAGNNALNHGNIGISLMGNFEEQPVPQAQRQALAGLVRRLCARFGIDSAHIFTHRELRRTLCPGRHLQVYVDELRHEMAVARSEGAQAAAPHSESTHPGLAHRGATLVGAAASDRH